MKRLILISISLIFILLCACDGNDTVTRSDIEVLLPDGTTANGGLLPDNINQSLVEVESIKPIVDYYVGSSSTKKFHLVDCVWANKIKDENKVFLSSYNEFLEKGFEPCKSCNP